MDEVKLLLKKLEKNQENVLGQIQSILHKKEVLIKSEQNSQELSYEEAKMKYNELLKTYKLYCKILKINK